MHGRDRDTYVTTIWANQGGTWTAVFHQESTAAKR
jgi:hypothetical protein